jgi:hypothetical protein
MNALKQLSEVVGPLSIEGGMATLEDGTHIDLVDALAKQEELLASMREVIHTFQTGSHYATQNPYTRPYIRRALTAIKEFTGFGGDWMDANPVPPSAE